MFGMAIILHQVRRVTQKAEPRGVQRRGVFTGLKQWLESRLRALQRLEPAGRRQVDDLEVGADDVVRIETVRRHRKNTDVP